MFGNVVKGSIHGFKFEDYDGDGQYLPNSAGTPDGDRPFDLNKFPVEFELTGDVDGDGQLDTLRQTIDPNGEFWFTNLWPGKYTVREVTDQFPDWLMPSTPTASELFVGSMRELVWQDGAAMLDPAVDRRWRFWSALS